VVALRRVCGMLGSCVGRYEFYSTVSNDSKRVGLGVVKHLKDSAPFVLPTSAESRNFWEVIEFHKDGTVIETFKTPDVLRLHPRDVQLFMNEWASSRSSGRALISPRMDGSILYRTETLQSIVYSDRAVLFPSKRGLRETIHIAQTIKTAIGIRSPLPFEFKVLESLLSETTRDFEKKFNRITMVADTVVDDVNQNFHETAAELSRFVPITSKLNELQNDVQETLEAIVNLLEDDGLLKAMCLSHRAAAIYHQTDKSVLDDDKVNNQRHDAHMKMVSRILESYEFSMLNIRGQLNEKSEDLERNRILWQMQLDQHRNNILRFNIMLSIASLCGFLGSLPAAYLGMNVHSGLEDYEGLLWPITQASLGGGVLAAIALYSFFNIGLSRNSHYASKLSDLRSLRDLLFYHMDDLDQIIEMFKAQQDGHMSLKKFQNIARECFKGKSISQEEINLLYRVLLKNQYAAVEMTNLMKAEERMADALSHHTT